MKIAELLTLGGTARCAVLGVKVDDDLSTGLLGQFEGGAAGCRQGEVGECRIEHVVALLSLVWPIVGKSRRDGQPVLC